MPGGTGGPHRIQGVGFWAQQQYYNIFSVDSGPFIFRPPLKGLPEQPYPPNAFQSWTYSYNLNLIGQDRFPTGEQFWERPPLGPIPAENLKTWSWSYNLNLIGQDKLPVGEQVLELPPRPPSRLTDYTWLQATTALTLPLPPVTNAIFRNYWRGLPEQPALQPIFQTVFPNLSTTTLLPTVSVLPVPLAKQITDTPAQPWRLDQSFTASYNLNLIGKDAMLVGEQVYELAPSQKPPEQIQLHSWQWSYNLSLIGKDKLPVGDQISDLAPAQKTPEQIQLHSWSWSYNLNLRGKDQLPTGDQFTELPPRDPREVRAWSWSYNLTLIGQDKLPPGEQVYDRPALPIPPPALTWIEGPQYELIAKPFAQYDWPPAPPPYRIDQTWAASYNQNLIGQDKLPTGAQTTELPPRDFLRLFQTWIQSVNAALVTAPPNLNAQVHLFDYPNPRGAEPDWRRSWEFSYNKNLIGQDQLPFRQQDWPNPIAPAQVKDWIQQTNLALLSQPTLLPFRRTYYDLPPLGPQQPAQTWTNSYNLNLIGQDQLPARQQDWPLTPAAQRAADLATWINRVQFQLLKPFAQYDWPNPIPPFRDPTLGTIARGYNLDLIGQDRLPNRQQDWPLSSAFTPVLLQAWIQAGLLAVPLVPPLFMRNQDWPVPRGPIQPDRGFSAPSNPNLPPTPPVITPAVYNKPMLAGPGYLNVIPGEKPS